ncbi:MAG TPA: histidine phosphatase family protein [Acidimicrobiia bacterium]|nr:histidine phosphatase family protein [Acidimicrobiia bacterium]
MIRHGESRAQAARLFVGHATCTGLSDLGRTQAEALRDRLVRTDELGTVDAVYTSILARSIETAAVLGPAIGDVAPVAECDWCEIHPGSAEGLTFEELALRFPPTGDVDDPFHRRAPDGETWAEYYVRVGARLRRLAHEHPGETVVVVGHGGTVGASFVTLGNLGMRSGFGVTRETLNTSLTEWRWTGREWRLVRFNDAAHLADIQVADL